MSIQNNVTNPAFKGVYKVTMPKVDTGKDENEKKAIAETVINTLVMGANMSVAEPKIDKSTNSIYFKIDDKNDKVFESGFNNIINECNKVFNIDMAKKAYIKKDNESEYEKADALK